MKPQQKLPLGIQTFSKLIRSGSVYVDKTDIIFQLIEQGSVYFLSRPRRFGKSLLVSTFEALFEGEKNLFDGLHIATTGYTFEQYPLIMMEFSKDEFATADNLRSYIDTVIDAVAERYQITLSTQTYNQRFDELVVKLATLSGKGVVVLIDEYDKPILNNLDKPVLAEIKQVMSAFYSVIKSLDKHLRFVFITGVSKFAKVSVFSGMNNLTDISMDKDYATLCGITQNELELHFNCAIDDLAVIEQVDRQTMLSKIRRWYNGYLFEENAQTVYNPYSILSLFSKRKFRNYWFTTATPTFLLNLLQKEQFDLTQLSQFAIGEAAFTATEPEQFNVFSIFLQTGYLTIKRFADPLYILDFPNFEVEKSFYDSVVGHFGNLDTGLGQSYIHQLISQINHDQIAAAMATLSHFFANIPYDISINHEKYYQSLFYAIFSLVGLEIDVEVRTNKGRIDCVLQTQQSIYIIEFKLNGSKEDALQQIIEKGYAEKFVGRNKEILLIGVAFDGKKRNIGDFVIQPQSKKS